MKIRFLKAGNGDSFLLSFHDGSKNRNILIDGGVERTYYNNSTNSFGELKDEIDRIKERGEDINLLILTHIDNDHICGLIEWFRQDETAHLLVKKVWFNCGKAIAAHFREPENIELKVGIQIFVDPKTGVNEALEFESYLEGKGICWNQNEMILQGQETKQNGIEIQILSPNEAQLKRLLKEYKKVTHDVAYTAGKEMDWDQNIADFIEEEREPNFKFVQDTSPKNGSSISFILTFNGKRFLFLADTHPKAIIEQLNRMGFDKKNRLEVQLMKVSHHGSKGNTNKELLEIVKTDNYIISTDGSGHNHPNKRTLARILDVNRYAIFHFNYPNIKENIFSEADFSEYLDFKVKVTQSLEF